MTDFICIPIQLFRDKKEGIKIEQKISELYVQLLATHQCFTSNNIPFESHHRPHQRTHKTHVSKPQASEQKRSNLSNDPLKKFKGLLNVINVSNFDRINRKVQFAMTDKNAPEVCSMIIDTACVQVFFVHIFMKLLNHSIQTSPKIIDTCSMFIHRYFHDPNLFDIYYDDTMDYVEYQKQRKHAINTSLVVMEMIKNQHSKQYTTQCFVSYITDELERATSDTKVDLLLSVLFEIKKKSVNMRVDKARLKEMMKLKINSNIRLQFMLETLLK